MEDEKKSQPLFHEFSPVSDEAWREKIQQDLRGADFEKKLAWRTEEGFDLAPYYRRDDLNKLEYLDAFPGSFPFTRGNKIRNNDWYVRQDIRVDDIEKANRKALDVLMKGINSLGFVLDDKHTYSKQDIDDLFRNIFAEIIESNFHCRPDMVVDLAQIFYDLAVKYNRDFEMIHGSIDHDPLGDMLLNGITGEFPEASFERCKSSLEIARHLPNFSVISVNAYNYRDAGSSIVEELAFSLSAGTEYLTQLTEKGVSVDKIAPNIKFNYGIGPDYFPEIAKFRAARLLWANIVKAYGPSDPSLARMNIHAITLSWNQTVYDPYVNILRTTTESMSAIISGIDSLSVRPFNSAFQEPDEFAERIARNQQLLLKEESYLDKVADPAAGSYFVENLTDKIAEEAWKLFLDVEHEGGFIEAVRSGFIQDRINETASKQDERIARRRKILLGTNQYPNIQERIDKDLPSEVFAYPERSKKKIKTYRGGQAFGRLRYQTDQYANKKKRPEVFLFTFGNLAFRNARAQFTSNFFGCAGYKIINNKGFKTIGEGVEACRRQKPEIVVICSSDDEYAKIVPEIYNKLKDEAIIVVAGYPKAIIEKLKKAGIEHFIHLKSDVLDELTGFQHKLGII